MAYQNNETSNKLGVVKKCPNCGATVEMQMVRCPECGYHFGGVEANSSAKRLAAMLSRCESKYDEYGDETDESKDKKVNIILSFPVPNTKADLIEFMSDLLYRANHYRNNANDDYASAYKAKYRECATKAHVFFQNDPDFQHLFEIEADSKKIRWRNFSLLTKIFIVWLFIVALMFVMLFTRGY